MGYKVNKDNRGYTSFPTSHNRYFPHNRIERSQQLRGNRSGAVAIEDCWLWRMMAENSFSKTII